jgi:superfamily II DNA/RNA helicase
MNSNKVTEFAEIITNTDLLTYLKSVSISVPTPVQADCIPKLMGAGHFTVQSHTGTGKTLGYLLPLVAQLKALESKDEHLMNGSPKAVIVAPTRELAAQVFSVLKEISHYAKLRIRKLVGGDKGKSLKSMFSMPMDILVTTPDRCLRSFKNKELSSASLKYLILDEADQLLEPSFKTIMQQIARELQLADFQLFLVSATRPAHFTETISAFFPGLTLQTINAAEDNAANDRFGIFNMYLEEVHKFSYVNDFVRKQQYRNGVIFTGSKARAKRLAEELLTAGQKHVFLLHKDLEIEERVAVIDGFRAKGGILIATDIFARGIDVPHLQWVLNFDLPSEPYYYLHRSGRVGRSGREGDVYNFITSKDTERLERINQALITQGRTDLRIASSPPRRKAIAKSSPKAGAKTSTKTSTKSSFKSGAKPTTKPSSKSGASAKVTPYKKASPAKRSTGPKQKSSPHKKSSHKRK